MHYLRLLPVYFTICMANVSVVLAMNKTILLHQHHPTEITLVCPTQRHSNLVEAVDEDTAQLMYIKKADIGPPPDCHVATVQDRVKTEHKSQDRVSAEQESQDGVKTEHESQDTVTMDLRDRCNGRQNSCQYDEYPFDGGEQCLTVEYYCIPLRDRFGHDVSVHNPTRDFTVSEGSRLILSSFEYPPETSLPDCQCTFQLPSTVSVSVEIKDLYLRPNILPCVVKNEQHLCPDDAGKFNNLFMNNGDKLTMKGANFMRFFVILTVIEVKSGQEILMPEGTTLSCASLDYGSHQEEVEQNTRNIMEQNLESTNKEQKDKHDLLEIQIAELQDSLDEHRKEMMETLHNTELYIADISKLQKINAAMLIGIVVSLAIMLFVNLGPQMVVPNTGEVGRG